MPIQRITAAQFYTQIQQAIQSRTLSHDTVFGPIPDIVIRPPSVVFELQNERIRGVQQLQSLINDGSWQLSDLAALVYNEELVPLNGTRATVIAVFFRTTPPTTDQIVQAGYPIGTTPDQSTGSTLIYVVQQTSTMVAANIQSYFNSVTQRYELPVTAQCTIFGTAGSVGPTRLTKPLRPLVGFDGVTNPAGSNPPQDPETIPQLSQRYLISLPGQSPGVALGITKILRDEYPQTISNYIVYGNNPYLTRAAIDAGAVDVWIQGTTPTTIVASVPYLGINILHVLPSQPDISIVSIVNGATTYTQGVDYNFVPDTGAQSRSVLGQDGFTFIPGGLGSGVPVGTPLTVTYIQNALIPTLQTAFASPGNQFFGRNILFRAGIALNVTLSANYQTLTGFIASQIQGLLANAEFSYINSLTMGQNLQAFDINEEAATIAGIGNFVITNLAYVGQTGTSDIITAPNAYVEINATDINLTPV
jgi:hypothetical protein